MIKSNDKKLSVVDTTLNLLRSLQDSQDLTNQSQISVNSLICCLFINKIQPTLIFFKDIT